MTIHWCHALYMMYMYVKRLHPVQGKLCFVTSAHETVWVGLTASSLAWPGCHAAVQHACRPALIISIRFVLSSIPPVQVRQARNADHKFRILPNTMSHPPLGHVRLPPLRQMEKCVLLDEN